MVFPWFEREVEERGIDLGREAEPGEPASEELAAAAAARLETLRDSGAGEAPFSAAELTSMLRFSYVDALPEAVHRPRVRVEDGTVSLIGAVALDQVPAFPDLGQIVSILPDTLELEARGSIIPLEGSGAAFLVDRIAGGRDSASPTGGAGRAPGAGAGAVGRPPGRGAQAPTSGGHRRGRGCRRTGSPPRGEDDSMPKILIVDDESSIRGVLHQLFEYEGHEVAEAESGPDAMELFSEFNPDVTFLDVKMPGMDGLEVLKRLLEEDPTALFVMISGHGTIDTAVEATRIGAYDFLEKPLDTARLQVTLRNALEVRGLSDSVERLKNEVESRHEIVGASFAIRQVLERIERVAPADARVLITGENGTGKELVARAVHRLSSRSEQPFVEVNCAAIPSELIESELFGHIKGSFTGAVADRAGKFEQADHGTLFLDEIGDMSMAAQAKVLRALEEGVISRVGGSKPIDVDVRVLAATNKNIEEEIEAGTFREDLFYRLNVVPIQVPPLRERRDDIPMLVRHFAERMVDGGRVHPRVFTDSAVERLMELDWPGNVRELRNTVERLMILADAPQVTEDDVDRQVQGRDGGGGLGAELLSQDSFSGFKDAAERAYILQKLREHDWNVSETARAIDMPRSNLYKKIEKFGLVRED